MKERHQLRRILFPASVAALLLAEPYAHAQAPIPADAAQYGWLEGTVTNNQGQVIQRSGYLEGIHLKVKAQNGAETEAAADRDMGGLYSFRNLKPGVYDVILPKGQIINTFYCPERIWGVVVKPGQRTVLNIVMDQGETYEEIGKPTIPTVPATDVLLELGRLQKQVDDLKQQLAALMSKVPAPAAAPANENTPVKKP